MQLFEIGCSKMKWKRLIYLEFKRNLKSVSFYSLNESHLTDINKKAKTSHGKKNKQKNYTGWTDWHKVVPKIKFTFWHLSLQRSFVGCFDQCFTNLFTHKIRVDLHILTKSDYLLELKTGPTLFTKDKQHEQRIYWNANAELNQSW